MAWPMTMLLLGGYLALGRWLVGMHTRWRSAVFALLNLTVIFIFFFWSGERKTRLLFVLVFVIYLLVVCIQYLALRLWSGRAGWLPWLAFFVPISFLVFIRYAPLGMLAGVVSSTASAARREHPNFNLGLCFIGLSYLAFRASHLVLEVRNRVVPRPGFWEYLGFAFFAPTFCVGPISPYSQHRLAFIEANRPAIPIIRALMRVLVGAVKYKFLGPILNQLTYSGLLLDGHPHLWVDLPIAATAYYLYLYCNFSGFCDIAIGAAGLMGVPVAENFDNPFAARNVRDFWNHWHITLSQWMRDIVFSPLSKAFVHLVGGTRTNHAIALTITVVFLLIGIWHGTDWNYAAFGATQSFAVVINYYYTLTLKKRLGKEGFAAYNKSRIIRAMAITLTFVYMTACLFLFGNNGSTMKEIFTLLRAN